MHWEEVFDICLSAEGAQVLQDGTDVGAWSDSHYTWGCQLCSLRVPIYWPLGALWRPPFLPLDESRVGFGSCAGSIQTGLSAGKRLGG